MDVWGPFRVPSAEYGYHYLIGFTHEGSGYVAVYPTKRHDASVLISTTKRYWGDMARFDLDLKILRTDGGPEMRSNEFQEYLSSKGVTWERSAPYVHEQVGMQERRWGMIIPRAMATPKQCGARLGHWASAARYATYLLNIQPLSRDGDSRSPHERLTGVLPDLAPVRTFWSRMWGAVTAEQRDHKLSDRAVEGRFVGMAANGSAWVLYSSALPLNRHFIVAQATFDEENVLDVAAGGAAESYDLDGADEREPDAAVPDAAEGNVPSPVDDDFVLVRASQPMPAPSPAGDVLGEVDEAPRSLICCLLRVFKSAAM
jgi:hypothetical protein